MEIKMKGWILNEFQNCIVCAMCVGYQNCTYVPFAFPGAAGLMSVTVSLGWALAVVPSCRYFPIINRLKNIRLRKRDPFARAVFVSIKGADWRSTQRGLTIDTERIDNQQSTLCRLAKWRGDWQSRLRGQTVDNQHRWTTDMKRINSQHFTWKGDCLLLILGTFHMKRQLLIVNPWHISDEKVIADCRSWGGRNPRELCCSTISVRSMGLQLVI